MSRAAKSISLADELQADLDAWIKEYNVRRGPPGCNADDEGEPNANGHQNLIAQPGTSCTIEFRLMHPGAALAIGDGGDPARVAPLIAQHGVDAVDSSRADREPSPAPRLRRRNRACAISSSP